MLDLPLRKLKRNRPIIQISRAKKARVLCSGSNLFTIKTGALIKAKSKR
jgi:hypothetical protein